MSKKRIIYDSREHEEKNDHVLLGFQHLGYNYDVCKLYCGDYTYAHRQNICIDRKKDVMEIAGNICGKQHERFKKELIRANESGIKLYVLIEEVVLDLDEWQSPKWKSTTYKTDENGKKILSHRKDQPMTQVKGSTLKKAMLTMQERYGVTFLFCSKFDTAFNIIKLLNEEEDLKCYTLEKN